MVVVVVVVVCCRWSTIAAQLPGRTDNEIKNYWNTHLNKRLIHLSINPDTCAPASSLSLPPPSIFSPNSSSSLPTVGTTSFSSARHMSQWESARLEAEARLSCQSLLFNSSLSSPSFPTDNSMESESKTRVNKIEEAPDVILRIWNSEIGEAFRKPVAVGVKGEISETVERMVKGNITEGSSSSALTVSEVGYAGASNMEEVDGESISKGEKMTMMDETYQFYMDLAGGEDELSLFQSQMGSSVSCFSMFSADLDEASHDNTFK